MSQQVSEKKDKSIEFRIEEIKIINYFEKDFSEYGLKSTDIKNGSCQVGLNIGFDSKKGTISIPVKATFYVKSNDKDLEIFGIETVHVYKIKKFNKQFKEDENKQFDIPDHLLKSLIGTSVGGTRGMILASKKIPEYKKINLPLLNTSHLLGLFKKSD